MPMKKLIVAVTGASGAIYARKVMERILASDEVGHVALVVSDNARRVMETERESLPDDPRIVAYGIGDMTAPPASGSSDYDAMVVVPCSMGCVGRVAAGVSTDLVSRAADVMLKERRPLVLVVRESPLSTIHLRNMTALSECGAVILPASPAFYSVPSGIEELCDGVAEKTMKMLGLGTPHYSWGG